MVVFVFFQIKQQENKDAAAASTAPVENPPRPLDPYSFKGILSEVMRVVADEADPNVQNSEKIAANDRSNLKNSDDTQNNFSFAIIGDTKLFENSPASDNLQKAVGSIAKQNVNMVFAVGDLIFKCDNAAECENSYSNWKGAMSPLIDKTYEVVGNHDRSGGPLTDDVWQSEFNLPTNGPPGFNKQVYSFDYGNSHFVVLDTEKPHGNVVSKEQRVWLDQDLAIHEKQHTFVFFHEPAFPTSQFKEKSLDADPRQRNDLWKILDDHHVTAVINGHEHFFTRKKVGEIYQFIVGNTDAPENAAPIPGLSDYSYVGNIYAIVTVSGAKINLSLYSVDGTLINSFDFH